MNAPPSARCRQRGTTLLESLVAFLVLSLGMLTVARVQGQLRLNSDMARQRAEAVRLGQEDMERLRAFSRLAAAAGARAYADIVSDTATIGADSGYASPTRYQLTRRIDAASLAHARVATVSVGWTDRSGAAQQVVLDSIIAESDPLLSGALTLAPGGMPVKGALGRSVRIPLVAKNLGDGRSALKPVAAGSLAIVFDNVSGAVTGRCSVSAGVPAADLGAADLTRCDAAAGLLLSGTVRFASTSPPSASQINDVPLPLDVQVTLGGGTYASPPLCRTEAVTAGSDRHIAYLCVIQPLANGKWSGRTGLVANGWTLGIGAGSRKVCRYSSDLDASGAVDANIEHPASYTGVDGALANQNFLVIQGSDACPTGSPGRVEGRGGDVFANLSTVQHQP